MDSVFDLNINNYTINDLKKLIGLDNKYTFNDILKQQKQIVKTITDSNQYTTKNELNTIVDFFNSAVTILIESIQKQNDGLIEDYDELLIKTSSKNVVNKTSTTYAGHSFVMNKDTVSINDIINNKETLNPVETYPTNISRSLLNNVKRKTILQTIILNTLFREDYNNTSSTNFNIVLPYYFKQVLSLRLSSIQLPNVMYCVSYSNKNNTFYVVESTGIEGLVVIPDGNYNITEFTTMLQTEMNTQLNTENRFRVSFDPTTGRITISNNINEFELDFLRDTGDGYIENTNNEVYKHKYKTNDYNKFNCVPVTELYKRLGWVMGYRGATYEAAKKYTTEGIYNGASSDYIYFILNDFNNSQSQNIIGMFSESLIGNNILAMIPINSSAFSVCFDNGADFIEKKRDYFGPVNIQKLQIELLNQYGEHINLNNMDFSFSLELEIGYDW